MTDFGCNEQGDAENLQSMMLSEYSVLSIHVYVFVGGGLVKEMWQGLCTVAEAYLAYSLPCCRNRCSALCTLCCLSQAVFARQVQY